MILALSLMLAVAGLSVPTDHHASIIRKNKSQGYNGDSLALYSPKLVEQSQIGGAQDLPVLALYFFRGHLSDEDKNAFVSAIAAHRHGTGVEFPYAELELALNPEPPLRPKSVRVFNVGRCLNEKDCALTGAMLEYPDQVAQWKVDFATLTGELKDGATIEFDISLEHKASRYQAEFRGSLPLRVVESSRYQPEPPAQQ